MQIRSLPHPEKSQNKKTKQGEIRMTKAIKIRLDEREVETLNELRREMEEDSGLRVTLNSLVASFCRLGMRTRTRPERTV